MRERLVSLMMRKVGHGEIEWESATSVISDFMARAALQAAPNIYSMTAGGSSWRVIYAITPRVSTRIEHEFTHGSLDNRLRSMLSTGDYPFIRRLYNIAFSITHHTLHWRMNASNISTKRLAHLVVCGLQYCRWFWLCDITMLIGNAQGGATPHSGKILEAF